MPTNDFSFGEDYIEVAERIQNFFDRHPKASLRRVGEPSVMTVGGQDFVVYTAEAYRTPDDLCPGVGTAWEPVPGPTKFTKDSEIMNAETAAWGRAIVACGHAASRKIATREEVRNRAAEEGKPVAEVKGEAPISLAEVKEISKLYKLSGWKAPEKGPDGTKLDPDETLRLQLTMVGGPNEGPIADCIKALTVKQAETLKVALTDSGLKRDGVK